LIYSADVQVEVLKVGRNPRESVGHDRISTDKRSTHPGFLCCAGKAEQALDPVSRGSGM